MRRPSRAKPLPPPSRRTTIACLPKRSRGSACRCIDRRSPESAEYYDRALALFRNVGDRCGEARCHINIGIIHQRVGRTAPRPKRRTTARSRRRRSAHAVDLAGLASLNLGVLYLRRGQRELASDAVRGSAQGFTESANESHRLATLYNMAHLARETEDWATASTLYDQVVAVAERIGQPDVELGARAGQALAALAVGARSVAEDAMRWIRANVEPRPDWWFQGRDMVDALRIRLAAERGDDAHALRLLHEAVDIAGQHDPYVAAYLVAECAPSLMRSSERAARADRQHQPGRGGAGLRGRRRSGSACCASRSSAVDSGGMMTARSDEHDADTLMHVRASTDEDSVTRSNAATRPEPIDDGTLHRSGQSPRRARQRQRVRGGHRRERGHALRAAHCASRRHDAAARAAAHRRSGNGQGARRALHSQRRPARERAVRVDQLRVDSGAAARGRAVRHGAVARRRTRASSACSSSRDAARSSSTRSARCRWRCRTGCCARSRSTAFRASAAATSDRALPRHRGEQDAPRGSRRGGHVPRGAARARIAVLRIELPPLREREDDARLIADASARTKRRACRACRGASSDSTRSRRSARIAGRATCASSST